MRASLLTRAGSVAAAAAIATTGVMATAGAADASTAHPRLATHLGAAKRHAVEHRHHVTLLLGRLSTKHHNIGLRGRLVFLDRVTKKGLVQIGHACVVGEDNIVCAQTGLAGSSVLERNVLLAGQVGVSGHLTIHDDAIVYAQSGIGGDVPAGARVSGSPAFAANEWLRAISAFSKLPELLKNLRDLKKRIEQLEHGQQ